MSTEAEVRVALAAAVAYLDSGITIPAETLNEWRAMAGTTPNLPLPFGEAEEGFAAGMAASAAAARRWSDDEVAAVDRAIRRASLSCHTFTADDVWAELPREFPVTKGLGARLLKAARAGDIARTADTVISERTGAHGHGQRLAVWRRVLPHVEAATG